MDSAKEQEIEARLARIEGAIAALQRSVVPRSRAAALDDVGSTIPEWFSSRSPEWWLSRLGVGFVVLAILLLYGYAVDRGWITPPVRVLAGAVVGGILLWAGSRMEKGIQAEVSELGMRELLYGGALAIWYVTAYAASVWYHLISIPSARLLFFVLGIVSTWIALQERREIFAFLAVAAGFATPFILPAPVTSLPELALYLGAVAALGLIIYLMRGWPSTVWITFIAFWLSLAGAIYERGIVHPAALGSIAISFLFVVSGAAFVRAPSLRRRLLALRSERYSPAPVTGGARRLMDALDSFSQVLGGGKSAPDSLVLWVLTLVTPILAIGMLGSLWPSVPTELGGVVLVALGIGALSVVRRGLADEEIRQIALTAAALWALVGIQRIAPDPERIALSALFAALVMAYGRRESIGPRALVKIAIALALVVVVGRELSQPYTDLLRWRWVMTELVTLGASAVIAQKLIADPREKIQGAVLAAASYLTALLVIAHILGPIWAPLVTTSYAVLGAVLLILSRKRGGERLMLQLGGVTMLIVVARLLIVDMASVETIWRVLLFLVCGAVFLYTGYRLQQSRGAEQGE